MAYIMATMNRNVNLEEVNSDAFLGIPYLNYQSPIQKAVFWGSVIIGVAWNIIATFVFHINANIVVFCTIIPLALGVLFGCNFNQDLSMIQYLRLVLFHPTKTFVSKPAEDLEQILTAKDRMAREDEIRRRQEAKATPEEQKKLLIKLLTGVGVFVVVFIIIMIIIASTRNEVLHHMIGG